MTDNNTSNKTSHPSTSAANESTLQTPGDVRPCQRCPNPTGHPADRCPLRPLSTGVRRATPTVTTRPGPGSATTPTLVVSVGGAHIWHYGGGSATVNIQIPAVAIEPPTIAIQVRDKQRRRRRKRPNKAARRAQKAAEETNAQEHTPAAVKAEDNDDKAVQ
ncbi:hypothetical protein Asppvi_009465 [Aspergillus pseudoviridinutans]|uniref:Uncharacterized protein n=1 Tax=Aspergillus pseudoviridinutans TaxID=1517512 RepID=A0A9P3BMM9_9EURO|nr:uncharacterized protein Asppvi_009465 [Aspergillus pseudoviridinutans]GIJ90509.1 hypothetical protein Asppvi_009465 [Aspergillus pseudoviridinutans]